MENRNPEFQQLVTFLRETALLGSAAGLLEWDMETYMPEEASAARAESLALLQGLVHDRMVSPLLSSLLAECAGKAYENKLSDDERVIAHDAAKNVVRAKKLPHDFVVRMSETCAAAHHHWVAARAKSDFAAFLPDLKKIIGLKRREADFYGWNDSPYNALMNCYEPDLTVRQMDAVLAELKAFLVPFIRRIADSRTEIHANLAIGKFSAAKQESLNRYLAELFGFSFRHGRLDVSVHPFTTQFCSSDVRITTAYKSDDILDALSSTAHEVGHGLYEQGLPAERFGTALGEAISLGFHESQSRLWENIVWRSLPFWRFFLPEVKKRFPRIFGPLTPWDVYTIVNRVAPSLIRIQADEVTYNLHILLRYELEKSLIEGTLAPEDIPDAWNAKMREYLGVTVPDDAHGCLQDVHWSAGMFGYFPTYTLGNLISAQLFAVADRELGGLEAMFERGNFVPLLAWLRVNVHLHGKRYSTDGLVRRLSGLPMSAESWIQYIETKCRHIYKF